MQVPLLEPPPHGPTDTSRERRATESGWTIRYITELQAPVDFYLRGEEYSSQVDSFARSVAAKDPNGENTFASAAETDWVVERIAQIHEARS